MGITFNKILKTMIAAARDAGKAIMDIRKSGKLGTENKEDGSPVGNADREAERAIVERLSELGIPVFSEESFAQWKHETLPDTGSFLLVDPLDGTKEFIRGLDEFTVNIALITAWKPSAGVVFAPARGDIYWSNGTKAWKNGNEISVGESSVLAVSRSHMSPDMEMVVSELGRRFGERGKRMEILRMGSSLKICAVAEGLAGAYLRITPINTWDIAAAHAVLNAAGGFMADWNGNAIDYRHVRIGGIRATNHDAIWNIQTKNRFK